MSGSPFGCGNLPTPVESHSDKTHRKLVLINVEVGDHAKQALEMARLLAELCLELVGMLCRRGFVTNSCFAISPPLIHRFKPTDNVAVLVAQAV